MSIVKEIDKLSGTNTRSRNITQAIDKLTGKGPSKNIGDAVSKMDKDAPTEKLLMTGGAVVGARVSGGHPVDINNFTTLVDADYEGPAEIRFIGYKYSSDGSSEYVDYDNAVSNTINVSVNTHQGYLIPEVQLPYSHDTYMIAELGEEGISTYIINENADDRPESFTWDSIEVWSKAN